MMKRMVSYNAGRGGCKEKSYHIAAFMLGTGNIWLMTSTFVRCETGDDCSTVRRSRLVSLGEGCAFHGEALKLVLVVQEGLQTVRDLAGIFWALLARTTMLDRAAFGDDAGRSGKRSQSTPVSCVEDIICAMR